MRPSLPLEPLRGFRDILPPDSTLLSRLEAVFKRIAELNGYMHVIPPTLERFTLFALKSGEEIRRTMYVFKDKAGREVALRPEATASIARIYLKHLRGTPKPIRLYYIVNCFRYEEPQFARYREFWQAGVELLGLGNVWADIEVAKILVDYYTKLNMARDITLLVNNMAIYRRLFNKYKVPDEKQDLILHYMDKKEYRRAEELLSTNPELHSKIRCLWEAGSPENASRSCIEDTDTADAINELETFISALNKYHPDIRIKADLSFARGLAYYDGIIFEVKVEGFPVSIAGGGRYSGLIKLYGGEDVPGTGFAIGLDRTAAALKHLGKDKDILAEKVKKTAIIVLAKNMQTMLHAYNIQSQLVKRGIPSTIIYGSKKTLRRLGKLIEQGYTHAIIVGEAEAKAGTITVRDLARREQKTYRNIEEALASLTTT